MCILWLDLQTGNRFFDFSHSCLNGLLWPMLLWRVIPGNFTIVYWSVKRSGFVTFFPTKLYSSIASAVVRVGIWISRMLWYTQIKKIWGPLFSLLSKGSQRNFMLCTALVLLSASVHNTTLALLLT